MKVLLSAYACKPHQGSEPGVGWNAAVHLAAHHDVWVLTRANNRAAIEAALTRLPATRLRFIYHDLPAWASFWKKGNRGINLYYYLWQLSAVPLLRRLHREHAFDVAHHVTFVKYAAPSALAWLEGVPFVWGPVGGGDSAPCGLWRTLGWRGMAFETLRSSARWLFEHDPMVRRTARRAAIAIGTPGESVARLNALGCRFVAQHGESALQVSEIATLATVGPPPDRSVRFISIGRLLAWKGFHLGIMALAQSSLENTEYWIVGDGPDRRRLQKLVDDYLLRDRVRFLGQLPRAESLAALGECHVLVHPSLHGSGGWVCLEAMAAGRPVICLDRGGPGVQVTVETGLAVSPDGPADRVVALLAEAMDALCDDAALRGKLACGGQERVANSFSWDLHAAWFTSIYTQMHGKHR